MPGDWGKRPSKKPAEQTTNDRAALDAFVHPPKPAVLKRLNLNVPDDLHRRVKAGCAEEGQEMTAVIIELLEQRFPPSK